MLGRLRRMRLTASLLLFLDTHVLAAEESPVSADKDGARSSKTLMRCAM